MRTVASDRFRRLFNAAPPEVQRAFDKQVRHLLRDLRHPSLRAKKYDETTGLWQARVTGSWRFYFHIEGDTYILYTIKPHPK